jgi:hypothetical protein
MNSVETSDFEWTLPKSSTTEGPTFYIITPQLTLMTQMVYSSINSWSPTVQLVARISGAVKHSITLTKSLSDLKVSQDKLSATCGPMSVDFNDWGYTVTLKDGGAQFTFTTTPLTKGFKVGTGQHLFEEGNPDKGWVQSRFLPKLSVKGSLQVNGQQFDLNGWCMSTFVQQYLPQNVAHWNFCTLQNEHDAVLLYQV